MFWRTSRHCTSGMSQSNTLKRGSARMKLASKILYFAFTVMFGVACANLTSAQGLDPATLLQSTPDSWPLYHGDYSGQRHSHLTQISPANVNSLPLAWSFQTGQSTEVKSPPIV